MNSPFGQWLDCGSASHYFLPGEFLSLCGPVVLPDAKKRPRRGYRDGTPSEAGRYIPGYCPTCNRLNQERWCGIGKGVAS